MTSFRGAVIIVATLMSVACGCSRNLPTSSADVSTSPGPTPPPPPPPTPSATPTPSTTATPGPNAYRPCVTMRPAHLHVPSGGSATLTVLVDRASCEGESRIDLHLPSGLHAGSTVLAAASGEATIAIDADADAAPGAFFLLVHVQSANWYDMRQGSIEAGAAAPRAAGD